MSLLQLPLPRTESPASAVASATVRAMEFGQHLMAILLTTIGVIRATSEGVAVPVAIGCGFAILAWHALGTLSPPGLRSDRMAMIWLLGYTAIWIVALAISAEFIWLAFLLWLLAGHLLPLPWGLVFSGIVLVIVVLAPVLHHGATSYANVFGPLIGGVFAFGISRGLQDELALAQRHSGAIAERTRISRDIHDTIAQALSSIRLLAHAGAGEPPDERTTRTLAQVEVLARDSLADVRRIVAALAPAELEEDALAAALHRMLDRLHDESGLRVELHVDDSLPTLPTEVEVALLRTAQSALANVRRHAGASRFALSLSDAGGCATSGVVSTSRARPVKAPRSPGTCRSIRTRPG